MPKFVEDALANGIDPEQIADVLEIRYLNMLLDRELTKNANNELLANLAELESRLAQLQKPLLASAVKETNQKLQVALQSFRSKYGVEDDSQVDWDTGRIQRKDQAAETAVKDAPGATSSD